MEVLKWARANGCQQWSENTCASTVHGGQLETLKWARANGCPWDRAYCLQGAPGVGSDEMWAWIESQHEQ